MPIENLNNNGFYYWFAGFVDGEGCFYIKKNRKRWMKVGLCICLRKDDINVLNLIQKNLGFGYVAPKKIYYDSRCKQQNPQAVYYCEKKSDCLKLVEIFDKYPLLSKKKFDYKIWRRVVIEINQNHYGGYHSQCLQPLKEKLNKNKKYCEVNQ